MTVTLNPNVPPDTGESPGLGALRIRNLTQAIIDLLGLTANVPIATPVSPRVGPLTNRSGTSLAAGDLVTLDPANDTSVVLDDTTSSARPFVVATAAVANLDPNTFGQTGELTVHTFGVVTRGHYIRKSGTGGAAEDSGIAMPAPPPAGALGVAVTGTAAVGHATITALMFGATYSQGGIINPDVYGMDPNASAATNTMRFQAAIDAALATGGVIQFTRRGYHINAAINVAKPMTILGPGTTEVSTPGTYVLYLDTTSQIGFNVTSKGPFLMRDMSISGTTTTTHVKILGPTGTYKGTESALIENCVFSGGSIHVDVQSAIFFRVRGNLFFNHTVAGCRVQNTLDGDQGDSEISSNNIFLTATATAYGVLYLSGGGLKIMGNKFLGGSAGIAVDPTTTATDPSTISDLIIANNSIEGFADRGIYLARTSGALLPPQIHIVANQISKTTGAGLIGIDIAPGGAAGAAYQGLVIEGNYLSAITTAFKLRKVNGIALNGNYVSAATTGTIFDVDSGVTNLVGSQRASFDFTTYMTGTPGAGCILDCGSLTVAQITATPVEAGSTAFAINALGPQDGGGYTGYGMAMTAGGTGALVRRVAGAWQA